MKFPCQDGQKLTAAVNQQAVLPLGGIRTLLIFFLLFFFFGERENALSKGGIRLPASIIPCYYHPNQINLHVHLHLRNLQRKIIAASETISKAYPRGKCILNFELCSKITADNIRWNFHIVGVGMTDSNKAESEEVIYGLKMPDELDYWLVNLKLKFINYQTNTQKFCGTEECWQPAEGRCWIENPTSRRAMFLLIAENKSKDPCLVFMVIY